jgi:hypothetical protein
MRVGGFCRVGVAVATLIATMVALAFGAAVGLAADYQDAKHNVCEGNRVLTEGCPEWGKHVTGSFNVALGDSMMNALTSGSHNVASGFQALKVNTTGSNNLAFGTNALISNTEGHDNVAMGLQSLKANTSGFDNIALGTNALFANTTGRDNIANGVETLFSNTTGEGNIASGELALRANTSGSNNVAEGFRALPSNTTGGFNVALGTEALVSNTEGGHNVASGAFALSDNTSGIANVASGIEALFSNTTGSDNLASGNEALEFNVSGSSNVALGSEAAKNLMSGSNDIDIANKGAAAESGTTRIGTEGTQTRAFVAGVYKNPVTAPACAVKVNAEGQLGCNSGENSTAIATFASRTKTLTGKCLNYTDIAPAGTGACPAATTGYSSGKTLAGPTPANGATVTNLYADSNASVTGTDTALVAVIDNTTGATLLSCTVDSTTKSSCSDSSGSGVAAAGDNIEVKLTITGASGNEKLWRVTFRF